jgi:hypothetical protein
VISIGNGELDGNKRLKKGDLIDCPYCSGKHPVKLGKNEDNIETNTLMFYKCNGTAYLCGVNGVAIGKELI